MPCSLSRASIRPLIRPFLRPAQLLASEDRPSVAGVQHAAKPPYSLRSTALMRKLCLALLLLLFAAPAPAATLADAQIGFSADRTLVIDGHSYIGKIWA